MSPEASSLNIETEESKATHLPDQTIRLSQCEAFFKTLVGNLQVGSDPILFWGTLIAQVAKETSAETVFLFGYNETAWSLLGSFGMPNTLAKGGVLSRAWQSLPTIVSQGAVDLFSEDITKDRRFIGQMIRGTAVRTFLGITLRSDTASLGSLCIGFNAPSAQTEADRAFFVGLSKLMSLSLVQLRVSHPSLFAPPVGVIEPPGGVGQGEPPSDLHRGGGADVVTPVGPGRYAGKEPPLGIVRSEPPAPAAVIIPVHPVRNTDVPDSADKNNGIGVGAACYDITGKPAPLTGGPTETLAAPLPSGGPDRGRGRTAPVERGRNAGVTAPPIASKEKEKEVSVSAVGHNVAGKSAPPAGGAPFALSDVKARMLDALFSSLTAVFHGEDFSQEILKKIVSIMEADMGYLLRWDQGNQRLFPVASEGVLPEIVKRMERTGVKIDPIWGKMIDRNQPLLLSAENWKSPLKKRLCEEEFFRSQMTVPICCGNETWGVLSLFHRSNLYTQKELKLLESVGEKIGLAFEAVTLWDHLHRKITTLTMGQDFCQIMTKGISDLSSLLDGIKKAISASNAYLFLCDTHRNVIAGCAASGPIPTPIQEFEIRMEEDTFCPLTVRQGHPLIIENAPSDSRIGKRWLDLFRSRSLFSIPLILQGRVMGVLVLDETAYFRRFTEEEIQTAVALSRPAAFSIAAAIQYQEALEQRERQETLSMAILRVNEEERFRIAGAVGQGTVEMLEKARKGIAELLHALPAEGRKLLEESDVMLKRSVEEMKALSSDLYPALLEKQGLMAALRGYTETFSKLTGVSVQIKAPTALKRSSIGIDLLIYRIAQEAFCNVSKHANAKVVIFSIDRKETHWQMSITDDGKGFDTRRYFASSPMKRKGMGILGMKGRVEMMGGTFYIESEPQHGTRVSVKIPVTTKEVF